MALDLVPRTVDLDGRQLSLLVPRSPDEVLEREMAAGATDAPYWADLWPSGVALARELLRRDLTDQRVVELGCGVGLPSVAAALAGGDVLATDRERAAVRLAARNARRCAHRRVATLVADLLEPPGELLEAAPFDLVVAADVLYERRLVDGLARILPRLARPGGEALVAYPFAGQADPLVAALRAAGWQATEGAETVPGWHGAGSRVALLRLRAP